MPDAVLIEDLLEQLGQALELKPPTNLHLAASYQDIKDIRTGDMEWAGMLTPLDGGSFVITVRASDDPHRRNFTIGHEIAHTFLPGYTIIQHRCSGRVSPDSVGNRRLESLADVGAAELLLPRRYLRPIIADLPFEMRAVKEVANAHHASLDATLRRLLNLTDRHGIMIDLRRTTSPNGTTTASVHRVYSNSEWCHVAPRELSGTRIPDGHPLNGVLDDIEVEDAIDLSLLRTATPVAHVSAIADPYIDNEGSRVMRSLILATPRRVQAIPVLTRGRLPIAS